jgi:dTDP-4-dehydrorhamnose reductase
MVQRVALAQRPILVIGRGGQLGSALADATPICQVGQPECDFSMPHTIEDAVRSTAPRVVVNAAAYTAVDAAETDVDAAYCANRDGPAQLARLCEAAAIPLIHVSTDYVFDGSKGAPYVEADTPSPTGVYGASKLAGEQAMLAACSRGIVLRTSWLYSPVGRNFVRTMLGAAKRTDRLRVVGDQIGCPTTAFDLAATILAIIARIDADGWKPEFAGIYHAAGTGWTSWHGLACAAFEEAARHGLTSPTVEAIATADWPTPTRRPADSRLDCSRLHAVFGVSFPPWRDSLARTVEAIFASAPDR